MQHEFHRCPVTALAFLREDILLAGEGYYLKVYKTNSNGPVKSIKVFYNHAVHGIVVGQDGRTLLVWGGRYLRVINVQQEGNAFDARLGSVHSVDDWILDAAVSWNSDEDHRVAALITAHNALWKIRIDSASGLSSPSCAPERAVSGSNCILYTAHLKWLSAYHCLVACGTAFGDVLLWSCFLERGKGASSKIHYAFSAHEGSVFGVQASPPLTLPGYDTKRRLLASCSDDRTVRLWDVSDLSAESPTLAQVQRDTGFGSTPVADAHAPPLLAKVMAHTSRVWHVRFRCSVGQSQNAVPEMLSCGEDAFVNAWTINPDGSNLPFALAQVDSKSSHIGKNIWSVAQHENDTFATGGADGAIARYPKQLERFAATEVDRRLLNEGVSSGNDNFKAYAFVSDSVLVSTTEQGRVILIDLRDETISITSLSDALPGLKSYSVVTSLDGKAYVSGSDGAIYRYLYTPPTVDHAVCFSKIAQRSGKTAGVFAATLDDENVCLLATGVGNAEPSLYFIPNRYAGIEEGSSMACQLDLPERVIVTSFTVCKEKDTTYAIIGSRTGSVTIYVLPTAAMTTSDPISVPATTQLRLVHNKEAITSLTVTQNHRYTHSGKQKSTYLLSTARDGTLAIHRLSFSKCTNSDNPAHPSLQKIHHLPLPFGPNIEGLFVSSTNRDISAWGFRGKQFVYYDTARQEEIFSIECGGAHRNWAFQPAVHEDGGTFVWTKAGKVFSSGRLGGTPARTINFGCHGREIKSIAVSSALGDEQREILATGAEDTDIKLFHPYTEQEGGWHCLQTLRKHNTGIQHLAWDGEFLFSSGGFEEFFVWKVETGCPGFRVGVVCVGSHPRSGRSDLRICGFDVERREKGEEDGVQFDVEMVYSDSTVRMWRYVVDGDAWELRAEGEYLTSCLTHVIRPPSFSTSRQTLTASTDGHLALWSAEHVVGDPTAPATLTWLSRRATHQSAIHALVHVTLSGDSALVATGGDDNALALSRISASPDREEAAITTLLIPRAHAAAVTGLMLLPRHQNVDSGKMAFSLVSAGLDQRIKSWDVRVDTSKAGVEGIDVQKEQSVFTAVADVSGLDLCTLQDGGKGIVVCGVGMDVWRLPPSPSQTHES